jgi:hypothetical protein
MNNRFPLPARPILSVLACLVFFVVGLFAFAGRPFRSAQPQATASVSGSSLLEAYRHVEVSSVSDALEQLLGRKMYMTHKMRPIFPSVCRLCLDSAPEKEANDDPAALNGMLAAIDSGSATRST